MQRPGQELPSSLENDLFFPKKIQIECPHFALRGGTEPCKLRHPRLARPKPSGNPRGWRASRGSKTFPLLDTAPFSKGGMKDRIFPTLTSPFLLNPFWNGPKKGFWPPATWPYGVAIRHAADTCTRTGQHRQHGGLFIPKGHCWTRAPRAPASPSPIFAFLCLPQEQEPEPELLLLCWSSLRVRPHRVRSRIP